MDRVVPDSGVVVKYLLTFLLMVAAARGQVGFDDSYIMFKTNSAGFGITTQATYCAWVNIKDIGVNDIMGDFDQGLLSGMIFRIQSNHRLEILVYPGNYRPTTASYTVPSNEWAHVAGVLDDSAARLYINGVESTNVILGGPVGSSRYPIAVGARGDLYKFPTYSFNGKLHDSRIYTRALSTAEISEIYDRPWSLADDPDLVLRTCITTNDTGTALTGVARNLGTGADGTYSNSPTVAPGKIQISKPLTMELP